MDKKCFKRMMKEFQELTVKIADLANFINSDEYAALGAMKKSLLVSQYGAMMSYSKSLEIRIALERSEFEAKGINIDDEMKTDAEKSVSEVETPKKKTTTKKKSTTTKTKAKKEETVKE